MELIQGVDVNFVMPCMLPGHVSKGPFHSYGIRRHLVNRVRNDVLHKKKRSYFRFAPPPTPESPRQDRFKVLPTPGPKWQPRPQGFSLKKYFFKGKALGTRLPK